MESYNSYQELLRILPRQGAVQIAQVLGGAFVQSQIINIPPGAVVVGLRTRLGSARSNGDETYVPLVVQSVFAPGPTMSITFEQADTASGPLEVVAGNNGPAHGICGREVQDGARVEVWLKPENTWVAGRYERSTTSDGKFETRFALLQTDRTGGRPIFVGYKARFAVR